MQDDIYARMRSGSNLTSAGIFVLIGSFLATCTIAATKAGNPNAGYDMGQSPWLLGALALGVTLITLGQVKKMNAKNALEERHRAAHTTLHVQPDPSAGDGPFRPQMKETAVLDPLIAAAEQAEKEYDRRRGTSFLIAGGAVMLLTIVGMLWLMGNNKGGGPSAMRDNLAVIGLSIFPFGLGLFLGIKGLLLKSK